MKIQMWVVSCAWSLFQIGNAAAGQWISAPIDTNPKKGGNLEISSLTLQPPVGSTLLLGRGFNSVLGTVGGSCVQVGEVATIKGNPQNSSGQKVSYTLQEIQNLSDLKSELDLGLSASLGLGVWKGDLKAKYYRSNTMNMNNYYLALRVTVENETEILKDYQLTPAARTLYEQKGKEAFLKRCGDQFVAARVTGGEFIAIIEVETRSSEEKRDISAQINVGQLWSISPSFASNLANISKNHRVTISFFRTGDSGPLPPQDPQKLVEYALAFPGKIEKTGVGAWPFIVSAESYDLILDMPQDFVQLDKQYKTFSEFAVNQEKAQAALNEVDYILANTAQYSQPNLEALEDNQQSLRAILKQIREATSACVENLLSGCNPVSIQWPSVSLPIRTNPSAPASIEPPDYGYNLYQILDQLSSRR